MIIHVVKPGESLYAISQAYGVDPTATAVNNGITNPNSLVPGQTIVIQFPLRVHTIGPMDTLNSIAAMYGVSVMSLLRNNPVILDANTVYAGEEIVISYNQEKLGNIEINGYAYPYIDRSVLRKTLPYLTYITLFTYGIETDGRLIGIDDEEIIQISRAYQTAPLMLISTLGQDGKFSNELAHLVLNDMDVQARLIENILLNLRVKNYYGLDVDFEYVLPEDRDKYVQFISNLVAALSPYGYPVFVALAPKTSADQPGLLYEGHDYRGLGNAADNVLIMTYEWGYTYGPPMAVAPINKVREVLDYAITEIPPDKIFMGMPNYGYDWTLPFVQGESRARSLSNVEAVEQAGRVGAYIQYDETAQAPYYTYYSKDSNQHEVWFEDARSVEAKLRLVPEYGFKGVSYWNIMKYFPQNWLVANSLFDISKII